MRKGATLIGAILALAGQPDFAGAVDVSPPPATIPITPTPPAAPPFPPPPVFAPSFDPPIAPMPLPAPPVDAPDRSNVTVDGLVGPKSVCFDDEC
ncbi:MAG: hypothetical protein AB7I79_21090 [Rhizobiaceae bacterium]